MSVGSGGGECNTASRQHVLNATSRETGYFGVKANLPRSGLIRSIRIPMFSLQKPYWPLCRTLRTLQSQASVSSKIEIARVASSGL